MTAAPLPDSPDIVLAGGINMDLRGRTLETPQLGTSNPALSSFTPGGVARNVAENLARLGLRVRLLGAVGQDALGTLLLDHAREAGVDISGVGRREEPTGSYTAVLDENGELLIGLAGMQITEALTPGAVVEWLPQVRAARWLLLDANLPAHTVTLLAREAARAGARVVLEPVGAPKSTRCLEALRHAFLITPDVAELRALSGLPTRTDGQIEAAARELTLRGAAHVLVTLGLRGSLHLPREGTPTWTPAWRTEVADVTGAGDSFIAGVMAALHAGLDLPQAARWGHACAALTVESPQAVRPDLSLAALHARLKKMERT